MNDSESLSSDHVLLIILIPQNMYFITMAVLQEIFIHEYYALPSSNATPIVNCYLDGRDCSKTSKESFKVKKK